MWGRARCGSLAGRPGVQLLCSVGKRAAPSGPSAPQRSWWGQASVATEGQPQGQTQLGSCRTFQSTAAVALSSSSCSPFLGPSGHLQQAGRQLAWGEA